MNRETITMIGIAMMVFGSGILVYRGYDETREQNVLNIGAQVIKAPAKERADASSPLGWILAGGGALVLVGGAVFKPV
jgi:hypothetical protein